MENENLDMEMQLQAELLEELDKKEAQEEKSVMTEQLELKKDPEKKDIDPLEVSSMGFGLYFPVFKNLVNKRLSGSSAKRILIALFANKLENTKINLKLDEEVETLKIANKLFEDILVLHLGAMLEAEAKRQEIIKQNKEKESLNESSTINEGSIAQEQSEPSTNS